jgi:hypothetical protein
MGKTRCQQTQELADKRQKVGNRIATGRYKPTPRLALRALTTKNGATTTNNQTIREEMTEYYSRKLANPDDANATLDYLPNVDRKYPFDTPEFAEYNGLLSQPDATDRTWMHDLVDDEFAFHICLSTLKFGKCPGPDAVPNEILRALPPAAHKALHNLIRMMWATGFTPNDWKESTMILLFKNKGTPLELNYYRRIGLENTVYKLWTKMITMAMTDRAERAGFLTASQGGFRNKGATAQQIEMMIMALEDAMLTKQDIFLLFTDMTEAFDTISHRKLLMILYNLGFPPDAIETVKDLYTNARTVVQTPHGPLDPLDFGRGTIQGDSLSPFLFIMILYMEPLLRWLRAGGKGYKFGALAKQPQIHEQYQIMDNTYADDLNIVTGGQQGLANMKHQARKLAAYAEWGRLQVNASKSQITGAMHGSLPTHPYDCARLQTMLGAVRLAPDQPHLLPPGTDAESVTFLPPTSPFKHLGVLLTVDLNY